MIDIYLGLAIIGVLSVGCFALAVCLAKSVPRWMCDLFAILTILGMFWYMHYFWYQIRLVHLLPFSNLIIIGNWFPLAAGFLGGLAWKRVPGNVVRKSLFVLGLAVAAVITIVHPLRGETPICRDLWNDGVCMQTSPATCSAAAAATLLHAHGIEATEQEMAELCLTHDGTSWLGLYHGLKRKTAHTKWDVEVFKCTHDQLPAKLTSPVILSVELRQLSAANPANHIYHEQWGWIPGQPHSVVLFALEEDDRVVIGDPSVGREYWSENDLRVLWHGLGVRLVER